MVSTSRVLEVTEASACVQTYVNVTRAFFSTRDPLDPPLSYKKLSESTLGILSNRMLPFVGHFAEPMGDEFCCGAEKL